jgi:hypothetical protein
MDTEEELYADRTALRRLVQTQPGRTQAERAALLGRSLSWVKKWTNDTGVLWSRSRVHQTPSHRWDDAVVARILEMRDQPPEGLRRVPGPKAILYYLRRDPALQEDGAALPRSTGAVWRVLDRNGRIVRLRRPEREPVERPAPLTSGQLDVTDASTVSVEPDGKRGHVVAILNTIDVGTSVLRGAQVREDDTAATSVQAAADLVRDHGLPDRITFDRDPRFVGSTKARDVPAPFVRFWTCLGVEVTICPPHRPAKNAFVERYHRSDTAECLQVDRPTTVAAVREVTASYKEHDNHERPNQALSGGNRPPLVVDPDAWLRAIDGRAYVRRVQTSGDVTVGEASYDAGRDLAGHEVAFLVDARARVCRRLRGRGAPTCADQRLSTPHPVLRRVRRSPRRSGAGQVERIPISHRLMASVSRGTMRLNSVGDEDREQYTFHNIRPISSTTPVMGATVTCAAAAVVGRREERVRVPDLARERSRRRGS